MKSLILTLSMLSIASVSYAIPASYGSATHSTTKWQELATYDASNNEIDPFGVFWSTDGGATWGRESSLTVGQTIQFQFNMHKKNVGTHYADHIKAWVDWDQNGAFEGSEAVIYGEQLLPTGTEKRGPSNPGTALTGTNLAPADGEANFTFTSSIFTLDASHIGDLWLRARVTCSESLTHGLRSSWNDQWEEPFVSTYSELLKPIGWLNQGEVEEWKITVNPVPDSGSTLALLGAALCGVVFLRRRKAA